MTQGQLNFQSGGRGLRPERHGGHDDALPVNSLRRLYVAGSIGAQLYQQCNLDRIADREGQNAKVAHFKQALGTGMGQGDEPPLDGPEQHPVITH